MMSLEFIPVTQCLIKTFARQPYPDTQHGLGIVGLAVNLQVVSKQL